ncbi:MAG TPA: response regulator [Blastocatellia bacterium]|jgi:two-component system response regulator PilR (NtrC family)|nr:response regulator [Blastocatellia bacterium]
MQGSEARILFVDDDEDTCQMMEVLLGHSGQKVTTAATVAEALTFIAKESFDLYILDNRLPDGSGVELCRHLRESNPRVPVLFFSGAAYDSDIAEAMEAGAAGYIVKPAGMAQLETSVEQLLENKAEVSKVQSTTVARVRHHIAEKSKYREGDTARRNS